MTDITPNSSKENPKLSQHLAALFHVVPRERVVRMAHAAEGGLIARVRCWSIKPVYMSINYYETSKCGALNS